MYHNFLNKSYLLKWAGDLKGSLDMAIKTKEVIKNEKTDNILKRQIEDHIVELSTLMESNLYSFKDLNYDDINKNNFLVSFINNTTSYLFIKMDVFTYEVRGAVREEFEWIESLDYFPSFKNIFRNDFYFEVIQEYNGEVNIIVEHDKVLGNIHFSSLGIIEGIFYERDGISPPDRSKLCFAIVQKISNLFYSFT